MEVFETTETEANIAVDDDGTAHWLEKKRRRVSFAPSDTVHVIPRDDDLQTPPLALNADPEHNTPLPSEPSIAGGPASQSAVLRPSAADPNLLSGSYLHENSADFSHFSCDMDTGHGSWDDEEFTTSTNSLNGAEDNSGCFVHLDHISHVEDDDSIVNDVVDYDMTMDATTFSKNLSYYLKSSTLSDLQGTGLRGQVLSANDSDSRSLDDSMALTRLGAPHWALVNPQDVFMHADDEQTDMSFATGDMGQVASNKKADNKYSDSENDPIAFSKPVTPHCARVCPQDAVTCADDGQNDTSLTKGTLLKTTVRKHASEESGDSNNSMDMSLATGDMGQLASHKKANNRYSEGENDPIAFPKQAAPQCALVCSEDVFARADDGQDDMSLTSGSLLRMTVPKHATEISRDSNRIVAAIVVDQPSSQSKDANRNAVNMKPVLMEVKKRNEAQQLTERSLCPNVVEPRSLSKVQQPYTAGGRPVLADSTNIQHLPEGNLQEDKKLFKPSAQKSKTSMSNEVSDGVGNSGGFGKEPRTKGLHRLEDILQGLKGKTFHGEDPGEEVNMAPLFSTKLQTLGDYLQFSCTVQPQMDWLRDHVQELEAKLQAAKKRNAELRSSNSFVQKVSEESTHIFKSKFASKHSLAKKGWLLWKMKSQRQILTWLQDSKDNLLKEVEAVQSQGQQVLHLKGSYSQAFLKVDCSLYSGQSAAICGVISKESQLSTHHQSREMDMTLETYSHHYQDACEQLRILKAKSNTIQTQMESLTSAYGLKVQFTADDSVILFEKKLEALTQRLFLTINLLEQQQVMESYLKSSGGKSVVDFSLEGMCSQSFQFEEDNPHVKLLTTLHPEAIERTFPCMDASLLFQYILSDLRSNALVQMQHVHGTIQRTNYLLGCLMDVLKEIRYCRRNFWTSCKFKMQHDKVLLYVTFLRCVSGLKVILTFDMVFVKKGMYSSDLKPALIQIERYGSTSSKSITRREVLARIAKIQPGFARLYRICSCVEELMRIEEEV